jgi:ketosteroid isomerase-like protein
MDSMARPADPRGAGDSANMRIIKDAFAVIEEDGFEAGVEHLLRHCHHDCEFRPYTGGGQTLRGPDEVRSFFREQLEAGATVQPRPIAFDDRGDEIVVKGALRVGRPEGGFSESQLNWIYRFRDGRLTEAFWVPREAS